MLTPHQKETLHVLNSLSHTTHTNTHLKDTEFPGIVAKPIGDFKSASDYQYQLLQTNVNLLKLIQLGITFYNDEGERPPGVSTFQFNFKFCLRYVYILILSSPCYQCLAMRVTHLSQLSCPGSSVGRTAASSAEGLGIESHPGQQIFL